MKSHPRNEGSDNLDLAILVGMPVVTAVLIGVIWYLGSLLGNAAS